MICHGYQSSGATNVGAAPVEPKESSPVTHTTATLRAMPKKAVARQVATVIAAANQLQTALTVYMRGLDEFASLVEDGAAVPEALQAIDGNVGGQPRLVPDALEDFEAARNNLRAAIVVLALDQGMSGARLARRLGVSRQLVSRIAAEAP